MPRCFGASQSVRATSMPKSAWWALGVPHLLAVDHPLVAVELGPCRESGEVGAGARLAEQLAPRLLAREDRSEQPLPNAVGPVFEDRRAGEPRTAAEREAHGADGTELVGDDVVRPRRQAATVPPLGPRRHGPPRGHQRLPPLDEWQIRIPVLREPRSHFAADAVGRDGLGHRAAGN